MRKLDLKGNMKEKEEKNEGFELFFYEFEVLASFINNCEFQI